MTYIASKRIELTYVDKQLEDGTTGFYIAPATDPEGVEVQALIAAAAAVSDAGLVRYSAGLAYEDRTKLAAGTSPYQNIEDKLFLVYKDSKNLVSKFNFPAPKQATLKSDCETVNDGNALVIALDTALKAIALSKHGNPLMELLYGYRRRVKLRPGSRMSAEDL